MRAKVFVILSCFCYMYSLGQNVQPVSPTMPTANAASLGLYGEVPVSLFTGTPSIGVPIHTIHTPYIDIPIGINYHASGFRPDLHPSWVGFNWSLDAGGAITRTVKGLPDEYNDGITLAGSDLASGTGYYFSHNYLNAPDWYVLPSSYPQQYMGFYDLEPDEFSFNFLGYSGKFYLDHLGNWQVQSDRFLKVSFTPGDFINPFIQIGNGGHQHPTFNKFVITDDKGVQYTFGTAGAIEYSVGMTAPEWDLAHAALATSWYLVNIAFPAGPSVDFTYERGPYQSSLVYYQSNKSCLGGDASGSSFLSRAGMNTLTQGQGISGTMLSPVYLTNITYPKENLNISFATSKSNDLKYTLDNYYDLCRDQSGNLPGSPLLVSGFPGTDMTSNIPYFTRNPADAVRTNADYNTSKYIWLKLDSIRISYSNDLIGQPGTALVRKKVRFNYYENVNTRLQLNSITISAVDGANPQTWSFSYEGSTLPAYLTEISDHWGFSNGNPLPRSSTHAYTGISDLYAYREPVAGLSLRGLISKIHYPTGGETKFYFENHNCNTYVKPLTVVGTTMTIAQPLPLSGTGLVGGARLSFIANYDAMGNTLTKGYTYQNGVLENLPKYDWNFDVHTPNGAHFVQLYENSAAIVPASSVSAGRHVGYRSVIERNQDGSYKTYTYSNHDWGYYMDMSPQYVFQVTSEAQVIPVIPVGNREFERGRLLEEDSYDAANRLVRKKEFTYSRLADDTNHYVRSFLIDMTLCTAGSAGNYQFSGLAAYYNLCYHFRNTDIKDHYYDSLGHELMTETVNTFDNNGYPTSQSVTSSTGDTKETRFTYPYNYTADPVLSAMTTRHMTGFPITTDKYINGNFQEGSKNTYALFTSKNFPALSSTQTKTKSTAYETRITYNSYDTSGNLLEFQKTNDALQSYIWGYGTRWPVAKITGASFSNANALLNSSIINMPSGSAAILTELNKLRTGLSKSLVTTFGYNVDGSLASQVDPAGIATSYVYDNIGRLQDIIDKDGNYIKKFSYNYEQQPFHTNIFYSDAVTNAVSRTDCGSCKQGSNVYFTHPAGKFSATTSQWDANQNAANDIAAHASDYAIANGSVCIPAIPLGYVTPATNWVIIHSYVYPGTSNMIDLQLIIQPINFSAITGWYSYISIGTIAATCFNALPSGVRAVTATESGRTWSLQINPSGLIQIKLITGPVPTSAYPMQLNTSYAL